MAESIMLTQIELKRIWNYDPETGLFTRLVAAGNTKIGGVPNGHNKGYIQIRIAGKLYSAHRLAWLYMTGEWPKNQIDHINGIRDDNRHCNLRDVTNSINQQNLRQARIDNTSGYLGVTWHKQRGKWYAKIVVNSKHISLGLFDDVHEAGAHYLKKKRELHEGCTI